MSEIKGKTGEYRKFADLRFLRFQAVFHNVNGDKVIVKIVLVFACVVVFSPQQGA